MGQIYMHIATGSTGTRDEWDYVDDDGETLNAIDRGEVVPVEWSEKDEYWVESNA